MQTAVAQTLTSKTCTRCKKTYSSPFKGTKGLCPECKEWLKKTRYTHCHSTKHEPVEFDEVRDTKYGKEYHCPVCGSWTNFGILADVFSLHQGRR